MMGKRPRVAVRDAGTHVRNVPSRRRRAAMAAPALVAATLLFALGAAARDLPDLAIVAASLRATGDCSGRTPLITGKVRVKNVGQGRGQIFTTREMIASHIVGRPEIRGGDRFVNSMRPGEVVTVEIRVGLGRPHRIEGTHTLVLTVDPERVFKEEDEANNRTEVQVALSCR